jgi:Flp pilus assembly protein TadG
MTMAPRFLCQMIKCDRGAAAVEMALVTPLLMIIMFGSFEMGNYFLQNHVVAKAVRDGARYAARRPFDEFASCVPSTDVARETRNITRTGTVDDGGTPRIANWTDVDPVTGSNTITVTVSCDTSGDYSGIYVEVPIGAPQVTVTATVSYDSLFSRFGLIANGTFTLRAQSQAAVMGV